MKDDGVSEVIGTILLFAIVILAAGIVSISLTAEIANAGESFPTVSFRESASPNYLYHAGGDALSKSEIRIFAGSKDITEKNNDSWCIMGNLENRRSTLSWKTPDRGDNNYRKNISRAGSITLRRAETITNLRKEERTFEKEILRGFPHQFHF